MTDSTLLPVGPTLLNGHQPRLFDRELSWLAFNRRLTYEAGQPHQPTLVRLLKLAQAATSLDEYFMVRMPLLKGIVQGKEAIALRGDRLIRLQTYLKALIDRQQAHFAYNLRPTLTHQGIHLLDYAALDAGQQRHYEARVADEVMPVLAALVTPPGGTMPDFSNLSLNLAVWLEQAGKKQLAWVKLPRVLPRFLLQREEASPAAWIAVPLEQVIIAYLSDLFPDSVVRGGYPFRVTRSTDLGVLDSETANLIDLIEEGVQQRRQQGHPVRLEVSATMPPWLRSHMARQLGLAPSDVYALSGWLGLNDLHELTRLPRPDLRATPWQSGLPSALKPQPPPSMLSFVPLSAASEADLFRAIAQQDILLHFPYHSFAETVERFVAQAATDPQVLTIKMTLYRTAVDAPMVRSLMAAARAGKQVVVLVELTAPLDEAINIHWAKRLEQAGAHVVYGVVGFRTHTNLVLVARREAAQIQQYAYLGTGDYLPDRPQPYEDLGLFTSRPDIATDLSHLFNFLTGCAHQIGYQTLMVAPGQLKHQLQALIQREAEHAQQGRPARLIVKLNLLADPGMIESLYAASQAGVEIDLIVRSICRLRPGVPGLSDRIRVHSLLGDFVEHSRIVYCQNGDRPEAWIGTADWTPRGLNERIEVMVPLPTAALVAEIDTLLQTLLADTQNRWQLQPNGQYTPCHAAVPQPQSAQQALIERSQASDITQPQ
ncbi:polyphosphate kinase 1 [Leptolyngbya iicbica]|uniref:Polyphosphate kinase n=1 Tax=Lyngbya confervoides BDU141951 TaxID=1574623 RepID=A0A8T6QT86_9CYAN|nr:polyphosphate kinase 1 [Leptolyngbya sp. LK]